MTIKIPEIIGDYRIINLIADPGFTQLYLGHHKDASPNWENIVTIKRSKEEYREDLKEYIRNEAEILSKLNSVYTPRMIEWDEENEEYLIFQYLTGKSLDRIGKLNRVTMIDLSLEIADAIDYIHSQGIIHRDLKPANVLMGDKITPIDFSISCIMGEAPVEAYGTPAYSPIELKRGLCNPEIDIYGLGATMFAMLTGRKPVTMEGLIDTNFYYLINYLFTRKNPLVDMLRSYAESDVLPRLIADCLNEDPLARPSISHIRECLRSIESKPRIFVQGRTYFLGKDQITLGTSADCDICIESPWQCIEDLHAIIYKEGDSWFFLDNSRSGSFIVKSNEFHRIHEIQLYDESYIALGYSESKGHHISLRFRT
jgi:serine/threonine protein kinase